VVRGDVVGLAGAVAAAAVACGGGSARLTPGLTAPGSRDELRLRGRVSGPGAGVAENDFAGWDSWAQASPKRFRSLGHGGMRVDAFVPVKDLALYDRGASAMPVGFRVARAGYDESGVFLAVTAMQKMAPGYDPEHGDWYYLVVFRDGRTATMQGPLESCRGCHERARARDYLFGVTTD
jgi:hypothetical protein